MKKILLREVKEVEREYGSSCIKWGRRTSYP